MKAVVSGLTMASKNANDAISMLEVAEGATLEISNMLIRMRELAVQSASGTYSDSDRDALDLEFGALMTEIDRIAGNTTWNTMSILNGGNDATNPTATKSVLDIQLGANASQKMELSLKAWTPSVAVDMQALNADGYNHVDGKSDFSQKADGLDARVAGVSGATTESSVVTFGDLSGGDAVTINGLILTVAAGSSLTGAEVAGVFDSLSTAALPADGAVAGKIYAMTGTFVHTDFTSAAASGNTVAFTSAAASSDVTDLSISGKTSQVITQGSAVAVTKANNESAFGDAVLYWNDNGTAKAINIDTVGNSEFAIDQLDKAILGVATERAKYGAYMSRLEHSSDNLLNVAQNTDQSRSRIEDADYAVETSELARTQIISQASTAMLAQANQSKQSVLSLLQG